MLQVTLKKLLSTYFIGFQANYYGHIWLILIAVIFLNALHNTNKF